MIADNDENETKRTKIIMMNNEAVVDDDASEFAREEQEQHHDTMIEIEQQLLLPSSQQSGNDDGIVAQRSEYAAPVGENEELKNKIMASTDAQEIITAAVAHKHNNNNFDTNHKNENDDDDDDASRNNDNNRTNATTTAAATTNDTDTARTNATTTAALPKTEATATATTTTATASSPPPTNQTQTTPNQTTTTANTPTPKQPPPGRACRIANCTKYKKAKSHGYCQHHYKLHGPPEKEAAALAALLDDTHANAAASPKVAPPGRGCRMAGCTKYRKAKCDGFCLTCHRNHVENGGGAGEGEGGGAGVEGSRAIGASTGESAARETEAVGVVGDHWAVNDEEAGEGNPANPSNNICTEAPPIFPFSSNNSTNNLGPPPNDFTEGVATAAALDNSAASSSDPLSMMMDLHLLEDAAAATANMPIPNLGMASSSSLQNEGEDILIGTSSSSAGGVRINHPSKEARFPTLGIDNAAESSYTKPPSAGKVLNDAIKTSLQNKSSAASKNNNAASSSNNPTTPTTTTNTTKSGKYCNHPNCTKYKQSSCYGYCLTHVKQYPNPATHHAAKLLALAKKSNERKQTSTHKRYLCKWDGCSRYIQSNCHGYCLTHVKFANYQEEDGEEVTKVRVRIGGRLLNGFCQAVLMEDVRREWGFPRPQQLQLPQIQQIHPAQALTQLNENENNDRGAEIIIMDTEKDSERKMEEEDDAGKQEAGLVASSMERESDDNSADPTRISSAGPIKPVIGDRASENSANENKEGEEHVTLTEVSSETNVASPPAPQTTAQTAPQAPPQDAPPTSIDLTKLDFEIEPTPQKKPNGAYKCKAMGCPKNSQSHVHGFCRAHHNRYLIATGQCQSWTCVCGEQIASFMSRCGKCHRWKEGKAGQGGSAPKSPPKGGAERNGARAANEGSAAAAGAEDDEADAAAALDGTENGRSSSKRKRVLTAKAAAISVSPWECGKCRMSNPGSKRRCGGCLAWKGIGSGSSSTNNKSSSSGRGKLNASLMMMDANNNNRGKHHRREDGSWECQTCRHGNYPAEVQCVVCRAPRPNWQRYTQHRPPSQEATVVAGSGKGGKLRSTTKNPPPLKRSAKGTTPASPQDIPNSAAGQGGGVIVATKENEPTANHPQRGTSIPAIANVHVQIPTSFSTYNNLEVNYYGDCKGDDDDDEEEEEDGGGRSTTTTTLPYAYISIHYDFNRAYYRNHDYGYLNDGIMGGGGRG